MERTEPTGLAGPTGSPERNPELRAIALVGAGLLAAAALALLERAWVAPGPSARPPAAWVADRGAGAAFGLDADLFVTARVELTHPVALAPAGAGGCWALCAADGWSGGTYRLELRSPAGELLLRRGAPGPARLASDGQGGVLVLPAASGAAWARLGPDGTPRELPPRRGAHACAWGGGRLALGGPGGRVRSFEGPREVARTELDGTVLALAAASGPGGWWAVVEGARSELVRLDAVLEPLWSVPWRPAGALLAPLPDGARVWRVDLEQAALLLLGRAGLERRRADPALAEALAAAVEPDGDLLVLTPGALLRFDSRGRRQPGQGGFDHLSGLALPLQPP